MGKRVAIIGGGVSGLMAIKCCLDEGLEPVCFERSGEYGGLWRYSENTKDGQGSVTNTTVINTSKEMMAFSDFPPPDDFPNFMHNTKVYDYFVMYCEQFKLKPYIQFYKETVSVKKKADFASTGRWDVQVKDIKSEEISDDVFDAILVCTGHHADKHIPLFPGQENFQGIIKHTHDYRNQKGFEDKTVVVIGIGNSAGDAAVDLSKTTPKVYLSTRRGAWVMNRVGDNGWPVDMLGNRRIIEVIRGILPRNLLNTVLERKLNGRFDHAVYSLQPKHRFDESHPMVNDELPNRVACGTVSIKPDVKRFTKTGIEFEDGSVVDNVDAVILGTGYVFGFPFLDKSVIEVKKNKADLFKYAYPPDLEHPTLAVVGFIQPWGAINPIAELQCRLAVRLFKGTAQLPSKDTMWEDIRKKEKDMKERYCATIRHTIQVDWVPFMDELAELNGCKPSVGKYWLKDPALAYELLVGPCTPYQYRLEGPGKWPDARKTIMKQWERATFPTSQGRKIRPYTELGKSSKGVRLLQIIIVIVVGVILKFLLSIL